ncbi:MAG TPA: metallophosphoesterase [Patescibacteria group bacterium]|nr:metallophosphoesterase [Patescibacteria group bacterium]
MSPESPKAEKVRIAAVGDLHVREHHFQPYHDLFTKVSDVADILLLCGDLTNTGLPKEAENLAFSLSQCKIPVIGVLGNHDVQAEEVDEVKKILSQAKFKFLDDEIFQFHGIGFAGVKGFGGGFEKHMLGSFGEEATKIFVAEAVNEALKLENALKQLESQEVSAKVVVLHYAPIRATIAGESEEIYAYLGSSRLAEVIDRFENIKFVVHGHAHHAAHSGQTLKGVPVYNVAFEVLKKSGLDPFLKLEV